MDDLWLILRTSSRHTLSLVRKLSVGGFDAWTPTIPHRRRLSRSRMADDVDTALMPSFAFARAHHLHDLLGINGTAKYPSFTIFHHMDRIPLVHDDELSSLRHAEQRARRMTAPRVRFRKGQGIRIVEGPFAGMNGTVYRQDGKFALVDFGTRKVKISTFILAQGNISNAA